MSSENFNSRYSQNGTPVVTCLSGCPNGRYCGKTSWMSTCCRIRFCLQAACC